METMTFRIDGLDHVGGDPECGWCWSGYPKPHEDCTGLLHASFGDENYDGDYWLYYRCDVCGDTTGDD